MTNRYEYLDLTEGAIRLARKCAIGSEARKRWLKAAREHYTQFKNAQRIARR